MLSLHHRSLHRLFSAKAVAPDRAETGLRLEYQEPEYAQQDDHRHWEGRQP